MGPRSVADMVGEIEGYASYFEDLAATSPDELRAHRADLQRLADRFAKLAGR
jgi:hypothetical protein